MEQLLSWDLLNNIALPKNKLINPSLRMDNTILQQNYIAFHKDTYNGDPANAQYVISAATGSSQPVTLSDCSSAIIDDYYLKWVLVKLDTFIYETALLNNFKADSEPTIKEEEVMSTTTRRTVRVELIDNDPGLDVNHSLVAFYNNVITEDDDATIIQEIIMNKDIAGKLAKHNQVRTSQVDQDVLKRTGNTVNLQPVKLKDLTWVVK